MASFAILTARSILRTRKHSQEVSVSELPQGRMNSKEQVFCAAPTTSQADRGGLGVLGRTGGSGAHTGLGVGVPIGRVFL